MFQAPFSFEGRIRRTEYGISYIVYSVASGLLQVAMEDMKSPALLLFFIPILWFAIAQSAKRCHDRGNSAVYMFIPFYQLWMLFGDSDYGPNEYGPNPKGLGNEAEYDLIDEIGQNHNEDKN